MQNLTLVHERQRKWTGRVAAMLWWRLVSWVVVLSQPWWPYVAASSPLVSWVAVLSQPWWPYVAASSPLVSWVAVLSQPWWPYVAASSPLVSWVAVLSQPWWPYVAASELSSRAQPAVVAVTCGGYYSELSSRAQPAVAAQGMAAINIRVSWVAVLSLQPAVVAQGGQVAADWVLSWSRACVCLGGGGGGLYSALMELKPIL